MMGTRFRQRRHGVVMLAFLGCIVAFTDRVNLSVAVVAMKEQFGWSQAEKGLLLAAFFAGYLSCMFFAGILATRFGGRRVAGVAVIIWSLFTLMTPWAANVGLPTLLATRIGLGMGEAGLFPATYELFGRWIPVAERGRAAGLFVTGVPVGTAIGLVSSGWLVERYGWAMPFYVFGSVGILWTMRWFRRIQDDPRDDANVGPAERRLLDAIERSRGERAAPLAWRRLLLRWPVCAVIAGQFATFWSQNMLAAWLPSYFRDVQGLGLEHSSLLSAGPWLAMMLALNAAGYCSDYLIRRGVSVTRVRKFMQCGGLLSSAACLLAAPAAHSPVLALATLIGATAALGIATCGFAPGNLDIAPRHGALMVGFSNTLGQIPSLIGVAVTGWLVNVTGTYNAAFVVAAAISLAGTVIFAVFFEAQAFLE